MQLFEFLMVLISVLLLLNIAVPQTTTRGEEAIEELAQKGVANRFFLITLGFGDLPKSPIFLGALEIFGALSGGDRWTRPLGHFRAAGVAEQHLEFRRIKSLAELEQAVARAAAAGASSGRKRRMGMGSSGRVCRFPGPISA